MADIGKDRFSQSDEEEQKPRKFQVIDKHFIEDEEPAPAPTSASAAPAPAPEPAKEARTIKIDVPAGKEPPPPIPPQSAPEEHPEDAAGADAAAAGLNPDPLAISNAMLFFIEELFSRCLIFLGLTPNPQTGLTVKNLDQAQRGIQIIELLTAEIHKDIQSPELDANLQRMLAQLKAAYVQVVTGGGLGAGLGNPPGTMR